MKKTNIVTLFFLGGAIGVTLIQVSSILTSLFMGIINRDVINSIKSFFLTFICGGICFIIANISLKKIEKEDMNSIERQKILKKQMKIALFIIILFLILLVKYIIDNNSFGTIFSLSFIIVFSLWEYGYLLAYLNLKNNMVMIKRN